MSADDHDRERLRRAIELAAKGRFHVEPNPTVGCVLEVEGRVVGEGWHVAFGAPHAEVEALARAGPSARGATAYVSLEPCSRAGRTGPCTDALLEAGVRRVVYAATDPNEAGSGAARLREAGVPVDGPVLESEAAPLLGAFLRARGRDRPWIVLKWAMTLDGRIAEGPGRGGRITGPQALAFAHDLRAHADAVAVGVETVLTDDPRLTSRLAEGPPGAHAQPCRVVFDSSLRTPVDARLLDDLPDVRLVVYTADPDPVRRRALQRRGVDVVEVPDPGGRVDLAAAVRDLAGRGVARLLVEGGARLHGAFLRSGLCDQVTTFVAPRILGAEDAPGAVTGAGFSGLAGAARLSDVRSRPLGEDVVIEGYLVGPIAPLPDVTRP